MLQNFFINSDLNHFGGWWQNNQASGELTTQTHNLKLPVRETALPQVSSCDFNSLPLRLVNIVIAKKTFRGNWSVMNSTGILLVIKGIRGNNQGVVSL